MPLCPRCDTPVQATDLNCPHCGFQLKAHGHPRIELHQAMGDEVLCSQCVYHLDDSCTFPQRPYARACTLYQPLHAEQERQAITTRSPAPSWSALWQRYRLWLILLALFGLSLLLTLS